MSPGTPVLAAVLCLTLIGPVRADVITGIQSTATGVSSGISPVDLSFPGNPAMSPAPVPGGNRQGTILWHRHHTDAIYSSTGISGPAAMAFAGSWWISPVQVEAVPLIGDGTPAWTYGGSYPFVDASRDGQVLAAIDFDDQDSTAVIMEWRPGSSTPLWTYQVHPCRSLIYQGWASRKGIQVSDDGSTIAAAIVMYTPSGQVGRLFVFDAGNGTPVVDYPFPAGNVVATEITPDGAYIAMAGWPTLYVYDRYGHALRWSGPIYSGNDALAISGDGRYVAWGWSTFRLIEWNGVAYSTVWTQSAPSGTYVGQCALSEDGGTLALSWDNGSTTPNSIRLELHELPSQSLIWSYDFGSSSRTPARDRLSLATDVNSQMRFTRDGEHLAVASWGGEFPEVHVFERGAPEPIYTLDTPGSMFDIDVITATDRLYVTAAGKDVHAGTGGRGGDFYAIEIPTVTVDVAAAPVRPGIAMEAARPTPFQASTSLRFILERATADVRVVVHDAAGRAVRVLIDGAFPAGTHEVTWNGADDSGRRLAPGTYFVRLTVDGADAGVGKTLLLR